MTDQITFLPILEGRKVERTQATYYTSELYTKPLTPEHVLGASSHWKIERGQIPYPQNRWTAFDGWYLTNHWIHRMADKYQLGLFGWCQNGLHDTTIDDQPNPRNFSCRTRQYDDDIVGQVSGAVCVGMQVGAVFGCWHTKNMAREAGIYQTPGMPNNRWLPLHKATVGFRARVFMTCMVQTSTFLAAFALVDGCMSQLRGVDDVWNPLWGGLASGATLWAWYKKPFNTVPAGFYFGLYMAWFRFMVVPDGCPKLCLDFNRPGFGVIGGLPMWIAHEEPTPDTEWYKWLDKKYWTWSA
eukprot:197477_1